MKMITLKIDDPIQIILKLSGSTCNINCVYCYEKRRVYEDDEYLSEESLKAFLNTLGERNISIQLHGGEPLVIGMEKMKAIFKVLKEYKGNVDVSIQSNAVLLTEEWLDFFESEWPNIEIGLSIDGDEYANSYRVDYKNRDINEKIEKALILCSDRKRNIGIIAVANNRLMGRAKEVLTYFSKFSCIKVINFTPCFDYNISQQILDKNHIPEWAITPMEYADFIIDIFKEWKNSGFFNNFLIEPIFSIMRVLNGKSTRLCHFNHQKCSHMFTLYPNGVIGSCDELISKDMLKVNINEFINFNEVVKDQEKNLIIKKMKSLMEICDSCKYEKSCMGGCLNTRLNYLDTIYEKEYCESRIKMIEEIEKEIKVNVT